MQPIESIVRNGYLIVSDYPVALSITSPEWQRWLENHVKFRYEGNDDFFTAFKDNRGYWVAQKRAKGKLRQKRLGNSWALAKMSQTELTDIARNLCSQDYEQQRENRNPDRLSHRIAQLETEVGRWKDELYQLRQENDQLEKQFIQSHSKTELKSQAEVSEAIMILRQALKLKPNAGGAIKEEIRRALTKLQES
jgi:septal ring factor EnvC (AmiA/AmiB activator)